MKIQTQYRGNKKPFACPLQDRQFQNQDRLTDLCANLTDVTLADEDTNSILTENANRAIQGNVAIDVTLPGGQLWNQCKWCHLVAKFAANASGAIWWLNLQLK